MSGGASARALIPTLSGVVPGTVGINTDRPKSPSEASESEIDQFLTFRAGGESASDESDSDDDGRVLVARVSTNPPSAPAQPQPSAAAAPAKHNAFAVRSRYGEPEPCPVHRTEAKRWSTAPRDTMACVGPWHLR